MTARPKKAAAAVNKPDFAALLAGAKLPERTVSICLRGDLVAEHEELERQLEKAEQSPASSLAGNGADDLAERIEALQDEMQAASYTFRLRALPKPQWRQLIEAHPIRRDEQNEILDADRYMLVNTETFPDALIRACLVDPELDDQQWSTLNGSLTDKKYDDLFEAAWGLNRREVDIPFSHAASRMRRGSGEESKPPTD
jgi:hypothetical protein